MQVNSLSPDIFLAPTAEQLEPALIAAFAGRALTKRTVLRARISNFFIPRSSYSL
jgi:hypothetical protein